MQHTDVLTPQTTCCRVSVTSWLHLQPASLSGAWCLRYKPGVSETSHRAWCGHSGESGATRRGGLAGSRDILSAMVGVGRTSSSTWYILSLFIFLWTPGLKKTFIIAEIKSSTNSAELNLDLCLDYIQQSVQLGLAKIVYFWFHAFGTNCFVSLSYDRTPFCV